MKIAAYCRVSTDHEDQVNSLESQKLYFGNYIKNNPDWELIDIYADEGISGTQAKKRPAFMQMIRDANDKKIELILTKEISRFARNTLDSLQYTRQLKSLGVGVLFINDNINTLDPDAELRLTIMSSIAQEEVRKTSERVKWGQKRRMEQGVVFGSGIYGFALKNGQLSIKEDEAEVVRLIYHKFVHEGKGSQMISRELYEAGYKSKYSSEWSTRNILNIIKNEKYVGDLLQKKFCTPNYLDHKKVMNKNNEDMIYIKDHHTPIVDRDLWNRAQEELKRRSPASKEKIKYSNRYWCSGKIKCGICGARYVQKTSKRKYGLYRVWVCHNTSKHGANKIDSQGNHVGCNNINVNYKTLMTCMQFMLNMVLKNKDNIQEELLKELAFIMRNTNNIDLNGLKRKMKKAQAKKEKLFELYVNNIYSIDELKASKMKYEDEIQSYEKQIDDFENSQPIFERELETLNKVFKEISKSDLTNEEMAEEVFKQFLERIIISQDHIEIKLHHILPTVHLYYETKGVKNWYETNIIKCEIK